jgi:hypothetical protein
MKLDGSMTAAGILQKSRTGCYPALKMYDLLPVESTLVSWGFGNHVKSF